MSEGPEPPIFLFENSNFIELNIRAKRSSNPLVRKFPLDLSEWEIFDTEMGFEFG